MGAADSDPTTSPEGALRAMSIRRFHDFDIRPGRVEFTVDTIDGETERSDRLWIDLPRRIVPRNDLVGLACSTLAGGAFDRVEIDLPLSERVAGAIRAFTGSAVTAREESHDQEALRVASDARRSASDTIMVSFSGGFDSLALEAVLPREDTRLVSLDWGGKFARERVMFERFGSDVVSTNIVELGYNRYSNAMMGIGAILLCDDLSARYHAFGSILDSVLDYWRRGWEEIRHDKPFDAIGLVNTGFAAGLTEVGTAMLVRHYHPEELPHSLVSLAGVGTEKLYRKYLLSLIALDRVPGPSIELAPVEPPTRPPWFGKAYLVDILSLYMGKHLGWETVDRFVTHVPDEAKRLSDALDLDFMERVNTKFLHTVPDRFLDHYLDRLSDAGISPYTAQDLDEFHTVGDFILSTRRPEPPTA